MFKNHVLDGNAFTVNHETGILSFKPIDILDILDILDR